MPSRPAMAVRCTMALVEPPTDISTRIAFSTDFGVMTCRGVIRVSMSRTAALPVSSAATSRSECTAGIAAVPGSDMPSASAMQAMVDAVPITAQVPAVTDKRPSTVSISSESTVAGAKLAPEAAAIGAGPEPLPLVAAGRHRPGHDLDGRQPGRCRTHQLRRHGLVTATDQHHGVHGLGTDHLLGVHGHEVAVHHAGRVEEHLAERYRGKRPGQCAGRQDPARNRLDQIGHVAMAVVEARRCHGDADDRLAQQLAGNSHRAREGTAQVTSEVAIAVVGEPVVEAFGS